MTLLHHGRVLADGPPDQVLTERNIALAYHVRGIVRRDPDTRCLRVIPLNVIDPRSGDDT